VLYNIGIYFSLTCMTVGCAIRTGFLQANLHLGSAAIALGIVCMGYTVRAFLKHIEHEQKILEASTVRHKPARRGRKLC